MKGPEPDKNDRQQSIRYITLYVTLASRPQKITQTRDSVWHQAAIYQTNKSFFRKDQSTFIHKIQIQIKNTATLIIDNESSFLVRCHSWFQVENLVIQETAAGCFQLLLSQFWSSLQCDDK